MREQSMRTAERMETERETHPMGVRYQTVCSVNRENGYCTYGLQCLESRMGAWILLDIIEDVSPCRDSVLKLASRCNDLQLSPLHFRDVVLDSVSA